MAVTSDGTPYVEPGDAISAYPVVSQELAAVIDSLRTMIPVGSIFPYAGKTAPEGWLMCDGKAYTRTDFTDLYVIMAEWVGQWGGFPNGNSQQFYVPDFRGRSPIGTATITGAGPVAPIDLGVRSGDWKTGRHGHEIVKWANDATRVGGSGGTGAWGVTLTANTGGPGTPLFAHSVSPDDHGANGLGHNFHPVTGVNFIVWTGTTTAGKSPVPGTELAPVTTRMMIEARLEQAGIGEEEIEMLREQLAALKEDTDG